MNDKFGQNLFKVGIKRYVSYIFFAGIFVACAIGAYINGGNIVDIFVSGLIMVTLFVIFLGVLNPTYRLEFFEEGMLIESIFKRKEIYYSEVTSFCFENKTKVGGGQRSTIYHEERQRSTTYYLVVYLKNVDKAAAHISIYENKKLVDFITKMAPLKGIPISK